MSGFGWLFCEWFVGLVQYRLSGVPGFLGGLSGLGIAVWALAIGLVDCSYVVLVGWCSVGFPRELAWCGDLAVGGFGCWV